MADKAITELVEATQITSTDQFVLEQNGTAKRLTGQTLLNWLTAAADGHGGIQNIEKFSTSGLIDTYRITLADLTTFDFVVTNGRAINNVTQTDVSGLTRTYTIAFNDGTSQTFTVTDGRSITDVAKTATSGLSDTYTITYNDGTTSNFVVANGRGISSFSKASSDGLKDNYTVAYNDGTTTVFSVANGRGIDSFAKTSSVGLVDTYTVTYNDGTATEISVANGRGIVSIELTSSEGLADTYTITYNDGTNNTFTVTNGEKGDKGDNTYTHIKFASIEPTEDSHTMGDIPDDWIGIYWGDQAEAPADWTAYRWCQIKGVKGDTGDAAVIQTQVVEYQASNSGTVIPSGSWSVTIPPVPQGYYLWTRSTVTFNSGDPIVSYSIARYGLDGTGSVTSVAGVSPDAEGNVPLTAENVDALPITGGTMMGSVNMNGQTLNGLNAPAADDAAATKGYVDVVALDKVSRDGSIPMTADLPMGGNKITGLGAPTADGDAVNLGVLNNAVRAAAPHNLLDNSDFSNPVNQRGQSSYTGGCAYSIDRWCVGSATGTVPLTIHSGYITLGTGGWIYQFVPEVDPTKKYTLASCDASGNIYLNTNPIRTDLSSIPAIVIDAGADFSMKWAALYEGEYTAETLPEYQPKGYGVELAECLIYFHLYATESARPSHGLDCSPPMRIAAVTQGTIGIDGTTYYYNSADL